MRFKILKVIAVCVVIGLCLIFELPIEIDNFGGVI